jgi:hypothetical protein
VSTPGDPNDVPPAEMPELELAPRPAPAAPPPPAPPAPDLELARPEPLKARPSAPGAVRSAARAQPLPEQKKKLTKEAVREGAVDVLLNSFSILREIAEDFRSSDRYFKYKALVLSVWFMAIATSVGVSCAGASVGNAFGARLIIAGDVTDRAYMLKNDSNGDWENVIVTVNAKYYATSEKLRPYGDISISPATVVDETGKAAPKGLVINEIHVSCSEGDAYVLKDGKPQ